jgi:hypothetical protein
MRNTTDSESWLSPSSVLPIHSSAPFPTVTINLEGLGEPEISPVLELKRDFRSEKTPLLIIPEDKLTWLLCWPSLSGSIFLLNVGALSVFCPSGHYGYPSDFGNYCGYRRGFRA